MRVVATAAEVRHLADVGRARGDRVGLVPTRGDLHDGHAAIIRRARAQCDVVICTIVRPDGTAAARELHDRSVAHDAGADVVWHPPPGPLMPRATVRVVPIRQPELADLATAAAQQLGIVRPDVVYVGDEHFDHARLLRDVSRDLLLGIELRTVQTPRDPDGLPFGQASRDLHDEGREAARLVQRTLDAVAHDAAGGERSLARLRARTEALLAGGGPHLLVEDVATVDPATFDPVDRLEHETLLVVRTRIDDLPLVDSRMLSVASVSP